MTGEIYVRGEQVSGEYIGTKADSTTTAGSPTNDGGCLDEEGYLFVEGRLDDVIVRGGENMSPGEIEDVLREHPAVADVAVLGVPDDQWGERVARRRVAQGAPATEAELAAVGEGPAALHQDPGGLGVPHALPYNDTGKLLRRVLRSELATLDLDRREGARRG